MVWRSSPRCIAPGTLVLLSLVSAVWGAGGDFYRIHLRADGDYARALAAGFPTVLAKPREYVDVIVAPGALGRLRALGLPFTLIQQDLEGGFDRIRARPDAGAYHRYGEMVARLHALAASHRDLMRLEDLGPTWETTVGRARRSIWAVELGRLPSGEAARARDVDARPGVLFLGGVHAREVATTEVLIGFIEHILGQAGRDPRIDELLDSRLMSVVPLLNPDGREHVFERDKWWRKNRRVMGSPAQVGVDLNRNFGFHWGDPGAPAGASVEPSSSTYRGPAAFSEPETQALRRYVVGRRFGASLAYHSYGRYILYPYGFTDAPTPDRPVFEVVGRALAAAHRYTMGPVRETVGYQSAGRHDDWLYGERREKPGVFAMEVEIGMSFFPPEEELPALTREVTRMNLIMARVAGAWLEVQARLRPAEPPADEARAVEGPSGGDVVAVVLQNGGLRPARDVVVRLAGPAGPRARPRFRTVRRLEGLLETRGRVATERVVFRIEPEPGHPLVGVRPADLQVVVAYTDGVRASRIVPLRTAAD